MSELTEMFSWTFRNMYKSLVYFIHSLLVTGETPRDPSTLRVLGNPAQASAPEDTSTVPMYFTVKTNKHLLQNCCVPVTVLGTVSAQEDKPACSEHFQGSGAKVSGA